MEATAARLRGLAELSGRLERASSVPELVSVAAAASLELLAADAVAVCRVEGSGGRVRVLHNAGDLAEWEQAWPADETYRVRDFPQAVLTLDGEAAAWRGSLDDPGTRPSDREMIHRLGRRHAMAVQLQAAGRVWGELYLTRADDPAFDLDARAVGVVLAGLISTALSRLELLADLSRLAYTDQLTGLANRRATDDWLHSRLSAHEPFATVTVLLCDINGMKAVNDRLGHPAGDELIRLVGEALTTASAGLDDCLAARVGGDEFVLLVQGATTEQVSGVTAVLTGAELPHGAGLAVGAAATSTRPAGAATAEAAARALLRLADAAQYRHKRTRQVTTDAMTAGSLPVPALLPVEVASVADRALDALDALTHEGRTQVAERLAAVADVMTEVYGCASWWVSSHVADVFGDVLGWLVRADSRRDLVRIEQISSSTFDPDDFPETARCLEGGSMFASLTAGDDTEREFLASLGYVTMLGAGERDVHGRRWLLELYGDVHTSTGLFSAEQLLRVLVHLAVTGARPR